VKIVIPYLGKNINGRAPRKWKVEEKTLNKDG
jgi:hypothetical protein